MYEVDNFKMKVVEEDDKHGVYQIGPLPKGYGLTFGNALRRILLSSIEGSSVVSVKVGDVKHEYTTLPGVMDDVLTIMLKLKDLALRSHADKSQTLKLEVKGKKAVKASDIELTGEVELANPDLEITELTTKDAKLEIEMEVEKGVGYKLQDESKRSELGVLPLDANFSPVKRVILDIKKTRVGQQTDLDQVNLEIFTNGALPPAEALDQAVIIYHKVTKRMLNVIAGLDELEEEEEVEEDTEESDKAEKEEEEASSDLDINKLNLSARLTNSLVRAGYENLTELEGKKVEEIKEIRGIGTKSADELIDIMKSYKLDIIEE